MSKEGEFRFRIEEAQVKPFIARLPFRVPNGIKIFFRNSDWKPAHTGLFTKEEAREALGQLRGGCLSDAGEQNLYVREIEEVHVESISS